MVKKSIIFLLLFAAVVSAYSQNVPKQEPAKKQNVPQSGQIQNGSFSGIPIITHKIRQVTADVTPAPGETFHVESKHIWLFTPGTYTRNHSQQFQISDRDKTVFGLNFMLTNNQENGMSPLREDADFQDYIKKYLKNIIETTETKKVQFRSFRPAGFPGVYTELHVKPSPEGKDQPLFTTIEAGMCRISERCILSYFLIYNDKLDADTRIQVYRVMTKLAKPDDAGSRKEHLLPDTASAWDFALKELPLKIGMEKLSEQFPFILEFRNDHWIYFGQPRKAGQEQFLYKVSTQTGEIMENEVKNKKSKADK